MIRIGPAGWSYADWEGIVYPRPKPRGFHGLPFLAEMFECVEINSSFYAQPNPEHARRWLELGAAPNQKRVLVPEKLVARYPRLSRVTRTRGQQRLF